MVASHFPRSLDWLRPSSERPSRDELAEAFIRGFQAGAEHPQDSGDGTAMYAAFIAWWAADGNASSSEPPR